MFMLRKKSVAGLIAFSIILCSGCRQKEETSKETIPETTVSGSSSVSETTETEETTKPSSEPVETVKIDLPEDPKLSEYYKTENSRYDINTGLSALILPEMLCIQTYDESEEYMKAYEKYADAQNHGRKEVLFPVDGEGNPVSPDNWLIFYDWDWNEICSYDLNKTIGYSIELRKVIADENTVWVLSDLIDTDTGREYTRIDQIDPEKGVVKNFEVPFPQKDFFVRSFSISSERRLYVVLEQYSKDKMSIFEFDESGTRTGEKLIPFSVPNYSNIVEWNGHLTFLGFQDDDPVQLYTFDEAKDVWNKSEISIDYFNDIYVHEGSLYVSNQDGLWQINGDECTLVLWQSVLVSGIIHSVKVDENGRIYVITESLSGEEMTFYQLTPSSDNQDTRPEFVIAGYNLIETPLPQLIEEISILHPDFHFVMRDYMNNPRSGEENGVYKAICRDIADGKAPDLYFSMEHEIDLGEMQRQDYLMDLSSYIGKLDQEKYFMNQLTMGKKEPKAICLNFSVLAFKASESDIKDPEVWDYEDFYESAAQFTDGPVQAIFSKNTLLKYSLEAGWENYFSDGKADFSGPEFLELLKWVNEAGTDAEDWEEYSFGKKYMLDWKSLDQIDGLIRNGDSIFLGYPGTNNSLQVVPRNLFAISSTTENPDLAWEILEYALSDEGVTGSYGFELDNSVNRACWNKKAEEKFALCQEDPDIELKFSKEEYVERYMRLLERADQYLFGSDALISCCTEDLEDFFSGKITAEQAAAKVQENAEAFLSGES